MRKVGENGQKRNSFTDFRGERMETLEKKKKKVTILYYDGGGGGDDGGRMAVVVCSGGLVVPLPPHTLVWSKAVNASRIEKRPKTASCSTSSFRCSHRPRRLKVGPNW